MCRVCERSATRVDLQTTAQVICDQARIGERIDAMLPFSLYGVNELPQLHTADGKAGPTYENITAFVTKLAIEIVTLRRERDELLRERQPQR